MTQTPSKILLVERDPTLAELLKDYLCLERFEVMHTQDGDDGLTKLQNHHFDILLLDALLTNDKLPTDKLGNISSFGLLKSVREISTIPIILFTDKNGEFETIHGLELGADDYISKPFNMRELLARIRANLRREKFAQQNYCLLDLNIGQLTIERKTRTATYKNSRLCLTDTEYSILELLALNCGGVVSKQSISQQIFRRVLEKYDRSIDMHMSNLRKKLVDGRVNESIKTIRGSGYMMLM